MGKKRKKGYPTELIVHYTKEELKIDVYAKQHYIKVNKDLKTVLGIIDSKVESLDGNLYCAFVFSLLHNVFLRASLYDLAEDDFMAMMKSLYDANAGKKMKKPNG